MRERTFIVLLLLALMVLAACNMLWGSLSIPAGSVRLLNLGDGYVTHGTVQQLRQLCGIDAAGVQRAVMEELGNG